MLGNLTGWHALIILAVVLLLFGATKLPALAKGVGQSVRIFRSELTPARTDLVDIPVDVSNVPPAASASVADEASRSV